MARIIKANEAGQAAALVELLDATRAAPAAGGACGTYEADAPATPAQRMVRGLDDLAAEAQKAMLDARQQAARLLADARSQADAACQAAAAKGYAEGLARGSSDGYDEGLRKGRAEARAELADRSSELVAQLRSIVAQLEAAHAETIHCGRCELLDFALAIAGKIVGRVAVADIGAARENLRKALELADRRREMSVKVNPGQLAALAEMLPELAESLGHTGQVNLVGDETVSPGGAKLQTAGGEIDATIETQLGNVVEALLGSRTAIADCGLRIADCHEARSSEKEAPQ